MKTSLQFLLCGITLPKAIVAVSGVLALHTASANLITDLRVGNVTGAGHPVDGKTVVGVDIGSIITMQVWAEITPDGSTQLVNTFGLQHLLGSIVSSTSPGGASVRGNMSSAVPLAPFNNIAVGGNVAELTIPPDGSLDVGGSATNSTSGYISFRSDPNSAGESVTAGGFHVVSNNAPAGAVFNPLPGGGYEFLMGTADFTVNALLDLDDPALSLNWVIPGFTTPANKGQISQWVQGDVDGHVDSGNLQFSLMSVGSPVTIAALQVPEPGTFSMLMIGLAGLTGRFWRGKSAVR